MVCAGLHMLVDALAQSIRVAPSKCLVNETIAEIVDVVLSQPHAQPVVAIVRQTVVDLGDRPGQLARFVRIGL